jgi:FOG: Ankyrin repeat
MSDFNDNLEEERTLFNDMPPNFDIPIYDGQNHEIGDYTEEERGKVNEGYEPRMPEDSFSDPGSLERQFDSTGVTGFRNTQFEQQPPMKKTSAKVIVVIVSLLVMAAIALIITSSSLIISYFKSDKLVISEVESNLELVSEAATEVDKDKLAADYRLVEPVYNYIYDGENDGLEKYIKENKKTINLDYLDELIYSPLYYAIMCENIEAVDILLSYGADVDLYDETSGYDSPLFMAIDYEFHEIITLLVSYEANVNAINQYGATPILWATRMDAITFKHLIENGADVTAIDTMNWNILHYAAAAGNEDIYNLCLIAGIDELARTDVGYSVAHAAVFGSNVELLQKLLDKGIPLEPQLDDGTTLLHMARKDEMAFFIMNNYECDYTALDKNNLTPLHWSAYYDLGAEVLQRYIENGADVNAQDKRGMTPLMNAVPTRETVQFLIDNGANISLKDNDGYAAYDYIGEGAEYEYLKNMLRVK